MTRDELALRASNMIYAADDATEDDVLVQIIDASTDRFLGVGAEQYENPDGTQSFESESVNRLVDGLYEEVIDKINYLVMIGIQAQKECTEDSCSIWVSLVPQFIRRELETAAALVYLKNGEFQPY